MTTLPATAVGEVRLDLNDLLLDGTDAGVGGYAYLWPNLRPGTIYRATNVDPLVAKKTLVTFTAAGLLQDPNTGAFPKVLASDAPGASFTGMQWVLGGFHLTGRTTAEQPADRYFSVPANSYVNVGLLADTTTPQPISQPMYLDYSFPTVTDTMVAGFVNSGTSSTRVALNGIYASTPPNYQASNLAALRAISSPLVGSFAVVGGITSATWDAVFTKTISGWILIGPVRAQNFASLGTFSTAVAATTNSSLTTATPGNSAGIWLQPWQSTGVDLSTGKEYWWNGTTWVARDSTLKAYVDANLVPVPELGYAERTSNVTIASGVVGTYTDIPGASVSFVMPSRPVRLEMEGIGQYIGTAQDAAFQIVETTGTATIIGEFHAGQSVNSSDFHTVRGARRITGSTGTTRTFKLVGAARTISWTVVASATFPAWISASAC